MFKNIRIPKRGGGTRLQRVKVLASGKYKFVKNVGTKRSSKTRRKSNPKRRVRKTVRRRRRNPNRRRKLTVPLAIVAPLGVGIMDGINATKGHRDMATKAWAFVERICAIYTGYRANQRQWVGSDLMRGTVPLIIGLLIHKFVGGPPLNLNRALGRAGVPILRI